MHISVVANCQARPVAEIAKELLPQGIEFSTIIVHLAKKAGESEDYALLDKADLIFAQFVTNQYFAGHLATSRLKSRYGDRVFSWPNIYFRGQTSDLAYASAIQNGEPTARRLLGPLREYHHRGIFTAWQQGMTVDQCLAFLSEGSPSREEEVLTIAARSIDELRKRESQLDTSISDLIDAEWRHRRLFFTFNHPTIYLLTEMAKRLLKKAGLPYSNTVRPGREALDLVIPPNFERDATILGAALGVGQVSRGAEVGIEGGDIRTGRNRDYSHPELIETSFRAYGSQLSRSDKVSFSPS